MNEHFLIFGLPRSMTAWVSCFLTCGDVFCQHDISGHYSRMNEFLDLVKQPFPVSGISDTGAIYHIDELVERYPSAKLAWVDRDSILCRKSLKTATGLTDYQAERVIQGVGLEWIAAFGNPKLHFEIFTTDELQTPEGATRLWNYVAPNIPLPPAHLEKMMSLKVIQHPKVYAEAVKQLNAA